MKPPSYVSSAWAIAPFGAAVHRVLGEPERLGQELDRLPGVVIDEDRSKALHIPLFSHSATVRLLPARRSGC